MAAGERGREPGGIGLPAQRQGRQLQPGGPALGAGGQGRHRRFRQGHAGDRRPLPQQRRRLVRGEPQLRGAQLGQLPRPRSRASASGGSLRLASTRCSPGGRCSIKNPSEECSGLGVNQVVVIEHQKRLVRIRPGGQLVYQPGHHSPRTTKARAARAASRPVRRAPAWPVQRGHTRGARTAPGRCRRRRATATPPAAGRAAPSRLAGPSCRTPPGRRPAPARAPGPRQGAPPAAGAAPGPGAARAHAAWWPARHHARRPPPMRPRRAARP